MKKRILSIMMVVMMLITMLPTTAFAYWTNSEQTVNWYVGKQTTYTNISGNEVMGPVCFYPDEPHDENMNSTLTTGTVPNGLTLAYGGAVTEPQISGTPAAGTVGTHVLTFTDSYDDSTLQVTINIAKGTQTIGVDDDENTNVDTISIPLGADYTLDTYSTDANGDKIDVSAVSADLVADHQPTYTYASSDTSIATVDETTGVITPVSQGTTTITINSATTESYEAATAKTITVTVSGHKVTSDLTNLTTTGSSGVGNGDDYTATLTADTGYALPESITVTGASNHSYNSSTGEITISSGDITGDITITASGTLITYTVTFKADGTEAGTANYTVENTTITEPTVPNKEDYTGEWETYTLTTGDVTVNAVYTQVSNIPQTLTFTNDSVTKSVGDTTFTNALSGANTTVTYSSSNEDVATVDTSGLVTIVGAGTATITATAVEDSTYQSATGSFALTVNEGEISLATDQTVIFDANYADLKEVILTVNNIPITLTQTDNLLSGYTGYTFNNGILGEVNEGSVEVTLYKEFLATLPAGSYSVAITTDDGSGDSTVTGTIPAKTTHTVIITNSGSGTSGTLTSQEYGTVIDLTSGTRSGYTFSSWTVTGDVTLSGDQCIVLGDGTITANWTQNSTSSDSSSSTTATVTVSSWYIVSLSTNGGGTLAPELSGFETVTMQEGTSYTFSITPYSGYAISAVYIDGTNIGAVSEYTIDSINSNRSIHVDFVPTSADASVDDAVDEAEPEVENVEEDATTTEADDTADSAATEDAGADDTDVTTDEEEPTEAAASESDSGSNSGSVVPIIGGVVVAIAALGGIGYFVFKRKIGFDSED